jgi:hypothetical protein
MPCQGHDSIHWWIWHSGLKIIQAYLSEENLKYKSNIINSSIYPVFNNPFSVSRIPPPPVPVAVFRSSSENSEQTLFRVFRSKRRWYAGRNDPLQCHAHSSQRLMQNRNKFNYMIKNKALWPKTEIVHCFCLLEYSTFITELWLHANWTTLYLYMATREYYMCLYTLTHRLADCGKVCGPTIPPTN